MTQSASLTRTPPLGIALYILAAIVLTLGTIAGLGLANARAAISGVTIAFQSPALMPLWDAIGSGLIYLGATLWIASLLSSALLVVCGRLLRRSSQQAQRLVRLEAALERAGIALDPATESLPAL